MDEQQPRNRSGMGRGIGQSQANRQGGNHGKIQERNDDLRSDGGTECVPGRISRSRRDEQNGDLLEKRSSHCLDRSGRELCRCLVYLCRSR